MRSEWFRSEDEFHVALKRLNALSGEVWRWEPTSARKDHIDLFEDDIRSGEIYFKKQYGPAFDAVLKLSRRSMERLLVATITTSPVAEELGNQLVEREWERTREAFDKAMGDSNE